MPMHSFPVTSSGLAISRDDEQGLLEARVEAREVGEVRAVLPVGVDDRRVEAELPEPIDEIAGSRDGMDLGRERRSDAVQPEVG
jgi:hypothetical protein